MVTAELVCVCPITNTLPSACLRYYDFPPMFRAEFFSPTHWANLFAKAGAKCESSVWEFGWGGDYSRSLATSVPYHSPSPPLQTWS